VLPSTPAQAASGGQLPTNWISNKVDFQGEQEKKKRKKVSAHELTSVLPFTFKEGIPSEAGSDHTSLY
jgi:ribosome-associated protein YbcJ (S4-like RNA binding protein)